MKIYPEELNEIRNRYPTDISDFDLKIVYLAEDGNPYGVIQLCLGNPSKKYIREVLLKYAPHLIKS